MRVSVKEIKNKKEIINLLKKDFNYTLFIINDLNNVNKIYGEIIDKELKSVLLIFSDKMVYYSPNDRDVSVYFKIIEDSGINKIVGKYELIEKFKDCIDIQYEYDSCLFKLDIKVNNIGIKNIKKVTNAKECEKLYVLFKEVSEYSDFLSDKNTFINNQMQLVNQGFSRIYYIEENNKIISTAASFKEEANSALLAGITTIESYRNKGYASNIISKLSNNLIQENKVIYLFYNNKYKENLYTKLGFKETVKWKSLFIN